MKASNTEWERQARIAQERADERRRIEHERARRLLPPGFMAKVGVLTVAAGLALLVWIALWIIGAASYDPAFSGR